MKATIPRLELSMEDLHRLVERARPALSEKEQEQLKAALDTLAYLTHLVEDQDTTIQQLRKILFGTTSTEKTSKVLENIGGPKAEAEAGGAETATADGDSAQSSTAQRKGHGRNGVQAYTGGNKVQVPHASLKRGDRCPECQKGKLYELNTPGVLVRVTG